ncbi:TIGR03790 family protein [Candidatus Uabimicrobium amorphum]|uniref:TIGR03790 family protein n=1 Tax=Uabimicrobium amorphum TaxID=2596890 RepID=A0A5S9ILK1_UABAM|nr:TIGR03790 family protein [Candidatus Uabimicrobium amorphum]BBM83954.1 hypothetical protein UABAM_02309 [Candidatus Uabimicrobium amorphum]
MKRALWVVLWLCHFVYCGGGAHNVALVVNKNSWSSLTIANEFIHERNIPRNNVIYLDYTGSIEEISIDEFRNAILSPILQALQKRRIATHIDYIVYSSDFPWRINFSKDFAKTPQTYGKQGSITGLTYLYQFVMARGKIPYYGLGSNWYFRTNHQQIAHSPQGFKSAKVWAQNGAIVKNPQQGLRYVISTMLGVTTGRGNSVTEIVDLLRNAAKIDATNPQGTFYFYKNNNVRSTTRHNVFPAVCKALQSIQQKTQIVDGTIPQNKNDILGVVIGTAKFNWGKANNRIIPGAICEHLTSFGGRMEEFAGQTPISELLRHGATGSSGTVMEPFAIQSKFPTPWIHYYYASGCSLGEAFYQSVQGPYQLLILGDPLCQPWAKPIEAKVKGIKKYQKVSGELSLEIESAPAKYYSILIDGLLLLRTTSPTIKIHTENISDGFHQIRVVITADTPIEQQTAIILPFYIANKKHWTRFKKLRDKHFTWGQEILVTVGSNYTDDIVIFHGSRQIANGKKDQKIIIDSRILGTGKVQLQAASLSPKGIAVFSKPLKLTIDPPQVIPKLRKFLLAKKQRGIRISNDKTAKIVKAIVKRGRLTFGLAKDRPLRIETFIEIDTPGVYQLQLLSPGKFTLKINEKQIMTTRTEIWNNMPLHLQKGVYQFELQGHATGQKLDIRLGQKGARYLSAKNCYVYKK